MNHPLTITYILILFSIILEYPLIIFTSIIHLKVVDLLVPITIRWIILVKIIKGYSRIIETDIRIYVMVRG